MQQAGFQQEHLEERINDVNFMELREMDYPVFEAYRKVRAEYYVKNVWGNKQ